MSNFWFYPVCILDISCVLFLVSSFERRLFQDTFCCENASESEILNLFMHIAQWLGKVVQLLFISFLSIHCILDISCILFLLSSLERRLFQDRHLFLSEFIRIIYNKWHYSKLNDCKFHQRPTNWTDSKNTASCTSIIHSIMR